ncbi:DUF3710 domain-containing protein [Micrococcus sp.]|uniref:DUF3710 domain-containing protein n=1 Tax=Micrococcus sp. TaxID=1271 RepID=UPI002A90D17C|nr:DUF3710 domain-containing protein [Micrococcus sp.]MDY6055512.1 DUF3710 domain-containing protein [Micrococcus sp.]
MIFGRNRNVRHEQIVLPDELKDARDLEAERAVEPAGADRLGPHDAAARPDRTGYIDLGSLRVKAVQDMKLRLDVEDATQRIVAATVTLGRSALQVQAFSAPRAGGVWDGLRHELADSLATTPGAQVQQVDGPFGPEVHTRVPAAMPDGSPGWNVARFVGVDGPRWFVRGVFHGEAAFQPEAATALEQVFSDLVVVRGDAPLPPRELLPLHPPAGAQPLQRRRRAPEAPAAAETGGSSLPERGPEITEVR